MMEDLLCLQNVCACETSAWSYGWVDRYSTV